MSDGLPVEEGLGLTAQLRRAAVSIGSNIAEGASRGTSRDFARFLRQAMGSVSEVETQVELSVRLYRVGDQEELLHGVGRLRARLKTLHDHVVSTTED